MPDTKPLDDPSIAPIAGAGLADDDLFAVWDASAGGGDGGWKSITKSELVAGLNATALSVIAGTSHTLDDTDAGKILVFTSASAIVLTVPAGLAAAFQCGIIQRGAGQVTVTAGGGVTLTSYFSLIKTAGAGASAALTLVAADDFVLAGTLGA
jgi:hypothetical protein